MGIVEEYRAKRDARVAEKKREKIENFKERRAIRLLERGIMPVEYRMDAPEGENNNQNSGGTGGGHGNTRLPFGLCMRYGIPIEKGWGPGDAWAALKDKGVTAKGAFDKLKMGADPGKSDPEPPKEPVKKIRIKSGSGEADYNKLEGRKLSYVTRGYPPWKLYADRIEGTYEDLGWRSPSKRIARPFYTKMDMMRWLKEKGVEEFKDPETGELVNPKEMEITPPAFVDGTRGFTEVSVGMRDGMYTVMGTDYDGKKKKLVERSSLADAMSYLEAGGAKKEDVKLSPALKKREKERVAWLSSDKKEYFTAEDGKKYGDIHIEEAYGGRWYITGESEDGEKFGKDFSSKAEMMQYFKDNGVEVVREGKETINPMDYEIPPTKVTISGRPYQDVVLDVSGMGEVWLRGIDLDGRRKDIARKRSDETLGEFKERIQSSWGVAEDQLTISDEIKAKLEEIKKVEEETERRRREFAEKAVDVPGKGKYMDIEVRPLGDYYGLYVISGYDERGRRRDITYSGDMYDIEHYARQYGLDIDSLPKTGEAKEQYEKYKTKRDHFEEGAHDFAGDKYADVSIVYSGGDFELRGTDFRGRERRIGYESSYDDFEKLLGQYGYTPDSFPMDEAAKEQKKKAMKVKYALATGEYYSMGEKDAAFKDIKLKESKSTPGYWEVHGTDIDGKDVPLYDLTWDDAHDTMSKYGVSDYKITDKDGKELKKPTYGMHKVILARKVGGGFLVYADSTRYGEHAIMYETPKESEAREWLKKNNVPESAIKTIGMNPNDDIPRTHTAKSLDNFDTHRMERAKGSFLDDLTDSEKKNAAEMLTEVFDKGEYRATRGLKHFGDIIENGYKSQIETGTGGTGAAITKSGRKSVSDKMFGHGGLGDTEYEKCGYLAPADDAEDYADSSHPFYGPMTLTFKKDRLKDRATYTWGDSLNTKYNLSSAGYAGEHPTLEGFTSLYGANYLREALDAYNEYKDGKITYSQMFKKIRRNANNRYVEMQFHGPVTVDDISKASWQNERDLEKTFNHMSDAQRKRVLKILKDKDVGLIYRTSEGEQFQDAWPWLKKKYPDDIPG